MECGKKEMFFGIYPKMYIQNFYYIFKSIQKILYIVNQISMFYNTLLLAKNIDVKLHNFVMLRFGFYYEA